MSNAADQFSRLVEIVAMLRSPDGCPWDREQTLESLTRYVIEEAYEVVDAIDRGSTDSLREEIGDHVFEGVLLAQVAAEGGLFTIGDSLKAVADKLVRRHPHVFTEEGRLHDAGSKERAPSARAALARWDDQKKQERSAAGQTSSALAGVPVGLPALLRSYRIGERAAGVGFDWPRATDVLDKIDEEAAELRETLSNHPSDKSRAEEEMGDLLFAISNLARKLGVEPEAALRKANDKFTRRFTAMEQRIEDSHRRMSEMSLEELEDHWKRVKDS